MKKLFIFFCFLLMACETTAVVSEKVTVGVYSCWKHNESSLGAIKWQQFSHIAIAAAYPLPDGSLNTELVDVFVDELVTKAHAEHKKVVLSVGGAGEASKGFIAISKEPDIKEKFISNLLAYVERHNIDGIDIDWEYWTYQNELNKGGRDPVESQYLIDLLADLRGKTAGQLLLSVDIAPGYWVGPQYAVDIQEHVDFVNLMAFDFTGAWKSSKVKHHSDYRTFVRAIEHSVEKGFNKNKLLIGLPTYGIRFIDSKNKQIEHVEHREIVGIVDKKIKLLDSGKIRIKNKGKADAIFFETAKNIEKKSRYIAKDDFAGFFVFDIQSDHPDTQFNLIHKSRKYITPVTHLAKTGAEETE